MFTPTVKISKKHAAIMTFVFVLLLGIAYFLRPSSAPGIQSLPANRDSVVQSSTFSWLVQSNTGCDRFIGTEKTDCEIRINKTHESTKVIMEAVTRWNPKLCKSAIESVVPICEDTVYFALAMKSKNADDCNLIKNQWKIDACKGKIASDVTSGIPKN